MEKGAKQIMIKTKLKWHKVRGQANNKIVFYFIFLILIDINI